MVGSKPWPQLAVGNENQTSAAVVIIGAGMGGERYWDPLVLCTCDVLICCRHVPGH